MFHQTLPTLEDPLGNGKIVVCKTFYGGLHKERDEELIVIFVTEAV